MHTLLAKLWYPFTKMDDVYLSKHALTSLLSYLRTIHLYQFSYLELSLVCTVLIDGFHKQQDRNTNNSNAYQDKLNYLLECRKPNEYSKTRVKRPL